MANDRPPDGEPPARQPGRRPEQDRPTPAPEPSAPASRDISIELTPRYIRIEPGEVITASIKVRNMGPVVDEITLTPRGEAGGWMRIAPDTLNIYPNTEAEATIRFASAARAASAGRSVRVRDCRQLRSPARLLDALPRVGGVGAL